MASFTPEQKAFIREVVFEAAPTIIEAHVDNCPWGKKITRTMYVAIGIGIGLGVFGVLSVPQIVEIVQKALH